MASKGEKVLEGWERRDDIARKENHKARAETQQNDPKAPGSDSEKKSKRSLYEPRYFYPNLRR